MPTTGREIIDSARSRHWSFTDLVLGDGAALLFLNQRLRTQLAAHGAQIEGLVNTSIEYAISNVNGELLGDLELVGVTNYAVVIVSSTGVVSITYLPTFDPTIGGDPVDVYGGNPGFPLPAEMVRLIGVSLVYNTPGLWIPCDVIPESQRFTTLPGRNPTVYVSENRLIPLLAFAGTSQNSGDRWFNVTRMRISYVPLQTLTALDDLLNIPAVLVESLVADTVVYLANQSKACDKNDKAGFREEAAQCQSAVADASLDLLRTPMVRSVLYKGN